MAKTKTLSLALLGSFLAGAALALPIRNALASAPTGEDQFSYLCVDATSAQDLNTKLNAAGARGWRVVAASPGPTGSVWCLSRLGPSPLAQTR